MKKTLIIGLVFLAIVCIFVTLHIAFPVYARMLPILFILFIIDAYLWSSIRRTILGFKPFWKYSVMIAYWLPLILLFCCIIAGVFVAFTRWNFALRTLLPGVIFILYVFKILPFIFHLIADILRLFSFGLQSFFQGGVHLKDVARMRWIPLIGWVAGTIFLILMILGMVWWNYDFTVKKQEIILPELPASFEGLKIVQISDIHLGSWACKKELRKAVDIVNSQHPDVIFFTGDMANYSTLDVLPFEEILTHLKAPYGIFAILGNHDYGLYVNWASEEAKEKDMKDLISFYHRLGWKLLMNEHSILRKGDDSIAILGVQNWGKPTVSRNSEIFLLHRKGWKICRCNSCCRMIQVSGTASYVISSGTLISHSRDIPMASSLGLNAVASAGARHNIFINNGEDCMKNRSRVHIRSTSMSTGDWVHSGIREESGYCRKLLFLL